MYRNSNRDHSLIWGDSLLLNLLYGAGMNHKLIYERNMLIMGLTKEQKIISKRNRAIAAKYFGVVPGDGLVLHHINPD